MDPSYPPDQPFDEILSLTPRSRASSGVSTTKGLLSTLQLSSSPRGSPLDLNASASSSARQSCVSSPYISPTLATRRTPGFVDTSQPAPFPHLPEDILNAVWFSINPPSATTQGPPILKVDPAEDHPQPASNNVESLTTSQSVSMSSVASMNFNPLFNMGPRSSYSWSSPEAGNSNGLLGHELGHYGSEPSYTPPSGTSSVAASPPRHLTAEQRELKRQHDQARRNSKNAARMRRAGSGSTYAHSPPVTFAELAPSAAAAPMPLYTTASPQISVLTEPVANLGPTVSYHLPNYPNSLPSDPQSQPTIFPSPSYQQPQYLSEYPPGFSTTAAPGIPSHYGHVSMKPHDQQQPPPQQQHQHQHIHRHHQQQQQQQQQQPPPHGMMYTSPINLLGSIDAPSPPYHAAHQTQSQQHPPPPPPPPHDVAQIVRVVGSRPKPQCWEHGCNGRQFSTFSNLLRHQREKSGQATKSVCPNCGAEFTRTTARNGHQQNDKCKARRNT